jgi:hypothetical protein
MSEGSRIRNKEIAKAIYKARGKSLDIKTLKKWKYNDLHCFGCWLKIENVDEIPTCSGLGKNENDVKPKSNECFFGTNVKNMIETAAELKQRMKTRQNIIDDMGLRETSLSWSTIWVRQFLSYNSIIFIFVLVRI